MATIAYKYGALWPKDWAEDCEHHMQLQTDLWNKLVQIYDDTGKAIQELTPSSVELTEVTEQLTVLKAEAHDLEHRIKIAKVARYQASQAKEKRPGFGDDKARLVEVRKALRETAHRRLLLARAARAEQAAEQVAAVYDKHLRRVKEARQQAAETGLWWSNYNAVITSFDGAHARIGKSGGTLKEKAFHGEGRLTVQIQGGATAESMFLPFELGGRTEARLVDGPPPGWAPRRAGRTPPTPDSKRSQRQRMITLAMTVYTTKDAPGQLNRRMLHVPLVYDRPLPADGRVQRIVLTRRRGNRSPTGDWRYEVVFILRVPEPPVRVTQRIAAVHIGWRTVEDGVRVATVADPEGCSDLVLPQAILNRFTEAARAVSAADTAAEAMRRTVNGWELGSAGSPYEDAPATLLSDLGGVRRARTGAGVARALRVMARNWVEQAGGVFPELRDALNAWCHQDLAARWAARNIQSRAVRHRRDRVRVWVAGLAASYDAVIIQEFNIMRLQRRDVLESSLASARRNVQTMAPGQVRALVVMTLKSRGVTVIGHKEKANWICHECGVETIPVDPIARRVRCSGCGMSWEVDENAAKNTLAVLAERVAAGGGVSDDIADTSDAEDGDGGDGSEGVGSAEAGRFAKRKKVEIGGGG